MSPLDPRIFKEFGYHLVRASTVRIEPDYAEIDRLRRFVLGARFDSAAFMSPRSIGMISPDPKMVDALSSMRVYAIGPSTRRSLERHGICVTDVPKEYAGRALAELIAAEHLRSPFKGLALVRSSLADAWLVNWLSSKSIPAEEFRIYCSMVDPDGTRAFMQAMDAGVEIVVFTSRSSSSLMFEHLKRQGLASKLISALKGVRVIAFGSEAASGLISEGIEPEILPVHSTEGLISHLKGERK
ncbi:MAG: uroporphyrinogen-III synthase [Candidatus Methanosuratincola petrocarbonis]